MIPSVQKQLILQTRGSPEMRFPQAEKKLMLLTIGGSPEM